MLVDGQELGAPLANAPYTLTWDTTLVPDGTHWLAALTADSTGVIGTSPVVQVIVANANSAPPSVQLTSPADGATLSSTVTLFAQAASGHGIVNVTFFVDGVQIGLPVTAPPFMIPWDTTTSDAGTHVLTATALDTINLTATSAPITITVDNTHPPAVIGREVTVSVDGAATMITPAFSTATAGDLLIAFVSYDGPLGGPQTATVSGAGLTWTLVERSNTQAGTSEIWTARPAGTLVNATVQAVPGAPGFHGSMTVIAFTNAVGIGVVGRTGAPTGAPDIFLPGITGRKLGLCRRQRLGSRRESDTCSRASACPPAGRHVRRRHLLGTVDDSANDGQYAGGHPRQCSNGRPVELCSRRDRRETSVKRDRRGSRGPGANSPCDRSIPHRPE